MHACKHLNFFYVFSDLLCTLPSVLGPPQVLSAPNVDPLPPDLPQRYSRQNLPRFADWLFLTLQNLTRAHPVVSAEHQRPGGGLISAPPPYDLENYAG